MIEEPKVKATLIMAGKDYIVEKYGQDAFEKVIEEAEPDTASILKGLLVSSSWLPEKTLKEFMAATEKTLVPPGQGRDFFYDMGYWMAEHEITGLYRVLFRFLNPKRLCTNAAKLWDLYHNNGMFFSGKPMTKN
jgi:hypothetical protein